MKKILSLLLGATLVLGAVFLPHILHFLHVDRVNIDQIFVGRIVLVAFGAMLVREVT